MTEREIEGAGLVAILTLLVFLVLYALSVAGF
jgi:hypothetical protein